MIFESVDWLEQKQDLNRIPKTKVHYVTGNGAQMRLGTHSSMAGGGMMWFH